MTDFEKVYAIEVLPGNLISHPKCAHGPTLLFRRKIDKNGTTRDFFACSAYRDRKGCPYFKWADEYKYKDDKSDYNEKLLPIQINHEEYYSTFKEICKVQSSLRGYCYNCSRLFKKSSTKEHLQHRVKFNISSKELHHPMFLLEPLNNNRKEAQYLFTQQCVKEITNIALKLGYCNFLCVGTPLIHEHIKNISSDEYTSLLLDIDSRFHSFYSPNEFCWYNSFNHYFFNSNAETVFNEFLMKDGGSRTCLFIDPPFGGRLEPLSQTLTTISESWQILNKKERTEGIKIPVFLIMPYFMESLIKANMPGLEMSDYKVSYTNHSKFNEKKSKQGSIIRFFTNIELRKLVLPTTDYKYCDICELWVSKNNSHCKKCNACTSKDGRTYIHCNHCGKCVKPTWKHCIICLKCCLPNHKCNNKDIQKIGNKGNRKMQEKNGKRTQSATNMCFVKKQKLCKIKAK